MKPSLFAKSLGIKYPIIQGGMAWVSDAKLAAAVSNGGGLGLIAAMTMSADQLRAEISEARKLTDKPFGVNIMLMSPFAAEIAEVVIEEKIPVITTGAGNPGKYMQKWNDAGIKVIPVIPSVALARRVERSGAFAVVAEGGEAGGHVGELTTLTLLPQVISAVNIPVIAAGGIADGRGAAAVFVIGAAAVQMGTRFLVAHECTIHQNYKDKVIAAKDTDTILTGKRLGHPVRSLKNQFSKGLFQKEYDSSISNEEFEKLGAGSLRLAAREGEVSCGCIMAGQIAGMVNKEQPAAEIILEVMAEATEILSKACEILA